MTESTTSITIIDDNEQILNLFKTILEREGYVVTTHSRGTEGLRQFKVEPTDILITDLFMPDKEGLEIIREIRMSCPGVKIIAISGMSIAGMQPGDYLNIADKMGADLTLAKPTGRQQLLDAVESLKD